MKKLPIKCLVFVYRHRYKIIGAMNACCAIKAIVDGNIHAFCAWLCALAWMNNERLLAVEMDAREDRLLALHGLICRVASGETRLIRDGNTVTEVDADRGWPEKGGVK